MVEWWTDLMMTAEMVLKSIGSFTVQTWDEKELNTVDKVGEV
jgi:hypothetical protein